LSGVTFATRKTFRKGSTTFQQPCSGFFPVRTLANSYWSS